MRAGKLVNGVLFQLVWVGCVWGGATDRWWLALASVVVFALWQVPRSRSPQGEIVLAAVALVTGLIVDTVYVRLGIVSYPHPGPWNDYAPIWILALWVGFALTLNHSMAWLKGRLLVAALAGGVAGAFSFWVGVTAWGAADFGTSVPVVLTVLGFVWAIIVPALVLVADRLNGDRPRIGGGIALAPLNGRLPTALE